MTFRSTRNRRFLWLALGGAAVLAAAVLRGTFALAEPVKIVPIDDGGGGGGVACPTPAIGCWKQLPNPAVAAVNMVALKTGQVLVHHRSFSDVNQRYQIFDPATNSFGAVQTVPVPHNMYCTGFDQLSDGRVLFAGSVTSGDDDKATIYDPAANTWAAQPNMAVSRFYPTLITLNHNELLVLDGDGISPDFPEVFDARIPRWRPLLGAAYSPSQPPPNNFDLPTYPRIQVISTGSVIYTGSREYFGQQGANFTRILDPIFQTWAAPFGAADPNVGDSGVMFERDTIMKAESQLTYTLAATTPGAQWTRRATMNQFRFAFFMPALPDGKILAIGDTLAPELYDPAANTWTNMASAAEARGDHSGVVLLQDGRILTAGPTLTAEVYSPPYLFTPGGDLAARPAISGVLGGGGSNVIRYGEVFKVTSPSAARVDSIRLIRLGAATHSWDMGQRSQRLAFTSSCCDPAQEPGVNGNPVCIEGSTCCATGTWECNGANGATTCTTICQTLLVSAPQHAYQAPPGYYYLFIVVDGVPSKAAIVKVE